jgi:hypothetical protein
MKSRLCLVQEIFGGFRSCPGRKAALKWFAIAVFGVMLANDTYGLTTIIRELDIQGRLCAAFDSFFRSSARDLHMAWIHVAIRLCLLIITELETMSS